MAFGVNSALQSSRKELFAIVVELYQLELFVIPLNITKGCRELIHEDMSSGKQSSTRAWAEVTL